MHGSRPQLIAHQQHNVQQVSANQQNSQQIQDHKFDNLFKSKQNMVRLKETLSNAMKVAGATVYQNASIDSGLKYNDQMIPRFDQSMEEFYAVCDQMELNLKSIQDAHNQARSSQIYTPASVAVTSTEPIHLQHPQQPEVLTYMQYINTVKTQVAYAKEIQTILANNAGQIMGNIQQPQQRVPGSNTPSSSSSAAPPTPRSDS